MGIMKLMKTTVEIPDHVYREAKSTAARLGIPFRAFLIEALERQLSHTSKYDPMADFFGVFAGEPETIYAVDRAIDADLERVDPDEWR